MGVLRMACCSADVCREDVFAQMAADLEMSEDDLAELLGECCASALERVEEVEGFLVSDLVNQASERQFGLMLNHLHSAMGGAAMMGLETLSSALGDLEKSIKQAKQPSGEISEACLVDFGTRLAEIKADISEWHQFTQAKTSMPQGVVIP